MHEVLVLVKFNFLLSYVDKLIFVISIGINWLEIVFEGLYQ